MSYLEHALPAHDLHLLRWDLSKNSPDHAPCMVDKKSNFVIEVCVPRICGGVSRTCLDAFVHGISNPHLPDPHRPHLLPAFAVGVCTLETADQCGKSGTRVWGTEKMHLCLILRTSGEEQSAPRGHRHYNPSKLDSLIVGSVLKGEAERTRQQRELRGDRVRRRVDGPRPSNIRLEQNNVPDSEFEATKDGASKAVRSRLQVFKCHTASPACPPASVSTTLTRFAHRNPGASGPRLPKIYDVATFKLILLGLSAFERLVSRTRDLLFFSTFFDFSRIHRVTEAWSGRRCAWKSETHVLGTLSSEAIANLPPLKEYKIARLGWLLFAGVRIEESPSLHLETRFRSDLSPYPRRRPSVMRPAVAATVLAHDAIRVGRRSESRPRSLQLQLSPTTPCSRPPIYRNDFIVVVTSAHQPTFAESGASFDGGGCDVGAREARTLAKVAFGAVAAAGANACGGSVGRVFDRWDAMREGRAGDDERLGRRRCGCEGEREAVILEASDGLRCRAPCVRNAAKGLSAPRRPVYDAEWDSGMSLPSRSTFSSRLTAVCCVSFISSTLRLARRCLYGLDVSMLSLLATMGTGIGERWVPKYSTLRCREPGRPPWGLLFRPPDAWTPDAAQISSRSPLILPPALSTPQWASVLWAPLERLGNGPRGISYCLHQRLTLLHRARRSSIRILCISSVCVSTADIEIAKGDRLMEASSGFGREARDSATTTTSRDMPTANPLWSAAAASGTRRLRDVQRLRLGCLFPKPEASAIASISDIVVCLRPYVESCATGAATARWRIAAEDAEGGVLVGGWRLACSRHRLLCSYARRFLSAAPAVISVVVVVAAIAITSRVVIAIASAVVDPSRHLPSAPSHNSDTVKTVRGRLLWLLVAVTVGYGAGVGVDLDANGNPFVLDHESGRRLTVLMLCLLIPESAEHGDAKKRNSRLEIAHGVGRVFLKHETEPRVEDQSYHVNFKIQVLLARQSVEESALVAESEDFASSVFTRPAPSSKPQLPFSLIDNHDLKLGAGLVDVGDAGIHVQYRRVAHHPHALQHDPPDIDCSPDARSWSRPWISAPLLACCDSCLSVVGFRVHSGERPSPASSIGGYKSSPTARHGTFVVDVGLMDLSAGSAEWQDVLPFSPPKHPDGPPSSSLPPSCPPKIENDIDGVPRYRGGADEVLAAGRAGRAGVGLKKIESVDDDEEEEGEEDQEEEEGEASEDEEDTSGEDGGEDEDGEVENEGTVKGEQRSLVKRREVGVVARVGVVVASASASMERSNSNSGGGADGGGRSPNKAGGETITNGLNGRNLSSRHNHNQSPNLSSPSLTLKRPTINTNITSNSPSHTQTHALRTPAAASTSTFTSNNSSNNSSTLARRLPRPTVPITIPIPDASPSSSFAKAPSSLPWLSHSLSRNSSLPSLSTTTTNESASLASSRSSLSSLASYAYASSRVHNNGYAHAAADSLLLKRRAEPQHEEGRVEHDGGDDDDCDEDIAPSPMKRARTARFERRGPEKS
ncbi:hypothetical protein R3P38DRAFT_2805925 [Favolaschia claudopus]|uniref:Uncharacterized protein n=1 Tax=Favolaschia claudopus TaxID=2862362 RepID=A0AAV9ZLY3_9AGAR